VTTVALEADLGVLLERAAGQIARDARARGEGFAIAAVEPDGAVHGVGDVDRPFAIQSISKVFGLALAIRHDAATVWRRGIEQGLEVPAMIGG